MKKRINLHKILFNILIVLISVCVGAYLIIMTYTTLNAALNTLTEEVVSSRTVILRKGKLSVEKLIAYLEGKQNLTAEQKIDLHGKMKPVLTSLSFGLFELARSELSEVTVDTVFLQADKNVVTQIINAEIRNQ